MITHAVAARLPEWARAPVRGLRGLVIAAFYHGRGRFCPVCGRPSRRFRPYGLVTREDAQCVHCGALERHRFVWLYISTRTNLLDGQPKTMLHVAPELCFESVLQQHLGDGYVTADLHNPRAMVKMDVTNIDYPDQSFDAIYCSHVLEHVQDDRRAMREFYRTLKTDGWAILLVPITTERTLEDSTVVEPEERLRVFGQADHVRRCGPDYADRLRDAGFTVEVTRVDDLAQNGDLTRMGITPASGEIYHCTR
jgi:predicted SAM-dependent methyltransferase